VSNLVAEAGLPVGLGVQSDEDRPAGRATKVPWLGGVLGIVVLLVVWEVLALYVFEGKHIMPTPTGVLRGLWDNRTLLHENAGVTIAEAAQGYLWGNVLAIGPAPVGYSELLHADHRGRPDSQHRL